MAGDVSVLGVRISEVGNNALILSAVQRHAVTQEVAGNPSEKAEGTVNVEKLLAKLKTYSKIAHFDCEGALSCIPDQRCDVD